MHNRGVAHVLVQSPTLVERDPTPWRWLALIVVLAAGIRLAQAARLEAISRDGAFYVRFARDLSIEPGRAMREQLAQPGFSVAMLAVNRTVGPWLSADPVLAWERSGQLIALAGGIAVVPLAFALARKLYDSRTGLVAASITAAWPHAVTLSADVLTDMPHLALYLACLLLSIRAVEENRIAALATCGVASGVAYLFRQEALALPIVAGLNWLWKPGSLDWQRRAIGVAVLAAAFALPVAPYACTTGKLLHKKSLRQLLEPPARGTDSARMQDKPDSHEEALLLAAPVWESGVIWSAVEAYGYSGRYAIGLLGLVAWFWPRVPASRRLPRRIVAAAAVLHLAAVLLRGRSFGVISVRYLVVPVGLTIPWTAAAIVTAHEWLRTRLPAWRWALVAAFAALLLLPLRHAPNRGKSALREAGNWLRLHTHPDDVILVPPRLEPLTMYADRTWFWPTADEREDWTRQASDARARWLVLDTNPDGIPRRESALTEDWRKRHRAAAPAFESRPRRGIAVSVWRAGVD